MNARPSLASANLSAAQARTMRAEWLTSLQMGLCTISDIVSYACEPGGRPLLRLGLIRLISEQDGWSRAAAVAALNKALAVLGVPAMSPREANRLSIQWLVDARSGGRRLFAVADAMDAKTTQPWPGFPYSAQPSGGNE